MRRDAKNMKRCGFIEKEIEPSDVFNKIKSILSSEGFALESQTVKEGFWDIRAGRHCMKRLLTGDSITPAMDRTWLNVQIGITAQTASLAETSQQFRPL